MRSFALRLGFSLLIGSALLLLVYALLLSALPARSTSARDFGFSTNECDHRHPLDRSDPIGYTGAAVPPIDLGAANAQSPPDR